MRQELGDLNDAEAVDKVLSVAGLNVSSWWASVPAAAWPVELVNVPVSIKKRRPVSRTPH